MSEFEGLCNGDHWDFHKIPDHWKGSYTRGSPKGRIQLPWNHVSPSQIENYLKCPRSWFFKSILKIPEGQKGHQSLGEAFHLIMEKVPQGLGWPVHADVDASPEDWAKAEAMAKIALPLLPGVSYDANNILDLNPITLVPQKREHGIRLETYPGGPTMIGYVDLGIPVGIGWPALMIPESHAIVVDYKTLSDFRYMKTPQELADSVQMTTYAKWALGEDDTYLTGLRGSNGLEPEHVSLIHLYARSKPPFIRSAVRHTPALVSPSEINSRWEKTLDTIREMAQVATCDNADDVEAEGARNGHCEAYGGCSFRDKCGIAKSSGIKSLFQSNKKSLPVVTEQSPMAGSSILEKIKQAQAKAAAANSSVPIGATSSPATGIPPASPVVSGSLSAGPGTIVNPTTETASTTSSPAANSGNQPAGTGPISGLMAKIHAKGQGTPSLGGQIAQAYNKETGGQGAGVAGTGELGKTSVYILADLMKLATGVVPPDAPSRAQEVITRPSETVSTSTGEDDDDDEEGTDSNGSVANPVASSGAASADQTGNLDVPVKRLGRPSNAEIEARKAQEQAAFEARVQAEVVKRQQGQGNERTDENLANAQKLIDLTAERDFLAKDRDYYKNLADSSVQGINAIGKPGLTLYVDCVPTKGDRDCVDFFEWIGPICAKVAQQNSVSDWRMINYTAKGLLASAIRETIRETGTPSSMTVCSYAGGADIALEVLTPIAKRVIKKI